MKSNNYPIHIPDQHYLIIVSDEAELELALAWYQSKNELRVTQWGQMGSLTLIDTGCDLDHGKAIVKVTDRSGNEVDIEVSVNYEDRDLDVGMDADDVSIVFVNLD